MKALRKSFVIVLCMVCMMLSVTMTAQATEIEKSSYVTIVMQDESTGNTAEKITLEFFEAETGAVYSTEVLKSNNWLSYIQVPTGKNLVLIVRGLDEEFSVVESSDHSKAVMEQTYSYKDIAKEEYWSIVGTKESASGTTSEQGSLSTYNGLSAKEAYQAFLDEISFIETDSLWQDYLKVFGKESSLPFYAERYSKYYADYVQGGTVEKYYELTPFEQFLWTNTYTVLAYDSYGSGDSQKYFGDKVHFDKYVVGIATGMMKSYPNSDIVISAYEKLMDWQFNYIVTEGNQIPYCFITDRSSLEEVKDVEVNTGEEADKQEQEDIEEMEQAIEDAMEEEEEKGIWSDTFDILANNALSVLILLILLVVLGVCVYRRKKHNID